MRFYYLILLLIFGYTGAFAQAGKLDSTFGVNGIATWENGGSFVQLQSNNKIIFGTGVLDSPSFNIEFGLSRYDTNGVLDNTFGINGRVETEVGSGDDEAFSEVIQPNDKIIVPGYCVDDNGYGDYALVRYMSNGKLDSTFNGNGIALTQFNTAGYADYGYDCALQADGKIVQVGEANDNYGGPHFGIVRYDSTGIIDNTFGVNGEVLTKIDTFPVASALVVTLQPDGKIIAGGYGCGVPVAIPGCFALVRYNTNGSLDSSFGINGIVTTYFTENDLLSALALQTDGKIVAVGTSQYGDSAAISSARYNINGSLDSSFGNNGRLKINIHGYINSSGSSLAIQPDGKILITGFASTSSNGTNATFILMRYLSNGLIDSTFGVNGIVFFDPRISEGLSIVLQPDEKILVGGDVFNITSNYFGGYYFIVRFLSGLTTGILNFSVKQNPLLIYPNPIQSQATLQYTLTENENINITLYDMQGKLVQTFITNQTQSQGEYKQQLNFSSTLASGNYILNISNGKGNQEIKISLVR